MDMVQTPFTLPGRRVIVINRTGWIRSVPVPFVRALGTGLASLEVYLDDGYMMVYLDPQGVVNGHPLTAKGL